MATTLEAEIANAKNLRAAGKYLTFILSDEYYGIEVLKVREIIRITDITEVPQMPAYIKGVINLRGKVVPIIDLRLKFALSDISVSERTCIVVVEVLPPSGVQTMMGVIVDDVEEVVQIGASDIEDTPNFGNKLDTEYILGMGKVKGKVTTLLHIDKVMATDLDEAMA